MTRTVNTNVPLEGLAAPQQYETVKNTVFRTIENLITILLALARSHINFFIADQTPLANLKDDD